MDSSALFALLDEERGHEQVEAIVAMASVSSVNMAEVYSKLLERGREAELTLQALKRGIREVVTFTDETAKLVGQLRQITRRWGLSLGDRACLATAITMDATVYTADRIWLDIPRVCPIRLIRS